MIEKIIKKDEETIEHVTKTLKRIIDVLVCVVVAYLAINKFDYIIGDQVLLDSIVELCAEFMLIFFVLYLLILIYASKAKIILDRIRAFFNVENALLVAMFVWFLICVWHASQGDPDAFSNNEFHLKVFFERVFICFWFPQLVGGNKKIINATFSIVVIVCSVLMFAVLIKLFSCASFILPNGGKVEFIGGRLELNCNPNTLGMGVKTLVMLSIYLFFASKTKAKYFYCFTAFINYCMLSLSYSRGGLLPCAVGLGMCVYIVVWDRWSSNNIGKKVLLSVLISGVTMVMVYCSSDIIRHTFITQHDGSVAEIERDVLSSPARIAIYKAAIKSAQDIQVVKWGVLPNGVPKLLNRYLTDEPNFSTHNEILEFFCSFGIVGLLIFVMWLLAVAYKGVVILFNKPPQYMIGVRILAIACFVELLNNMVESSLSVYDNFGGFMFYVLAGLILCEYKREEYDYEERDIMGEEEYNK